MGWLKAESAPVPPPKPTSALLRPRRKLPLPSGEHRAAIANLTKEELSFHSDLHQAVDIQFLGHQHRSLRPPRSLLSLPLRPKKSHLIAWNLPATHLTYTTSAKMRATRVLLKHTPLIKFLGRRTVPKRKPFLRPTPQCQPKKSPLTPLFIQKSTTHPKSTPPRPPSLSPSPSPHTAKKPASTAP